MPRDNNKNQDSLEFSKMEYMTRFLEVLYL